MAAITGAVTALIKGRPTKRPKAHERAMSVEGSVTRGGSYGQEKPKSDHAARSIADEVAMSRAPKCYQPNQLANDNAGNVNEIQPAHGAQRQVQKDEHANLQEKYDKLHKNALRVQRQRDDFQERCHELEQQCAKFERDRKDLEHHLNMVWSKYQHVVEDVIQPFSTSRGMQWNDHTCETASIVLDALASDAIDASKLRIQVHVLQKEMLAKLEKVQAITDAQLGQDFRNLIAVVKTLSRVVQISPEVNIVAISGAGGLLQNVDQRHWIGRARKKYLIEAWIWGVLVSLVFQNPYAIFGEAVQGLNQVWQGIFGDQHAQGWPSPTALCETWRYTTTEQLIGEIDLGGIPAGTFKPDIQYKPLELSMLKARSNVYNIIAEYVAIISATPKPPKPSQIGAIVDKAFALALQMISQRFRLQITYPSAGATCHQNSMSCLPDNDGSDIEEGTVAFIVNPGLTKWGDTHGKNLDHRFDIVRSLVQLETPEPGAQAYGGPLKQDV